MSVLTTVKSLKDVVDIQMGQSPESSSYNDEQNGLPFFQGNADFGEIYPIPKKWCNAPKKIAEAGDILVSVRAPIGAVNIASEKCCIGRGLSSITSKAGIDDFYLFHLLKAKSSYLQSQGTGSTFKAINKGVLESLEVPVPPFEEQQKIAHQLEKVATLITKRRQQLEKLDTLVKSQFVEMFGDLNINPKKWPIAKFDEFVSIDAKMIHDFSDYQDAPHIGIDSIEKETGELKGYRTVSEDNVISGKYLFTPDHIIYSKIRPNLNKVALPDFSGVCSADAYPLLVKKGKCNRVFLAYVLRSQFFLDFILVFSARTNFPKVNRQQLTRFSMPLPDIETQEKFADFVVQVDKSKFAIQQSLDKLELLQRSLMNQYFG